MSQITQGIEDNLRSLAVGRLAAVIACVQNPMSLADQYSLPVLDECEARGIAFVPSTPVFLLHGVRGHRFVRQARSHAVRPAALRKARGKSWSRCRIDASAFVEMVSGSRPGCP